MKGINWRGAAASVAALAALALGSAGATAAPNLSHVSNGWITDGSSPAIGAGATMTRGGDLLVVFSNSGDGAAGATAFLTRSSDEGRTWSTPAELRRPSGIYRDRSGRDIGSVSASLGLTTLPDGTLLLPFIESANFTNYTDRASQTYVARSTDDGRTWSGLSTPITFPTPMYFNATYGQIERLASGTLVMPVWGVVNRPPSYTTGGAEDPEPWQAGVLRSTDGGRTWGDYRLIGVDLVSPPPIRNGFGNFPSNVTETTVRQLRDGRLLALMRSDTDISRGTSFYASWSSNDGATWSDPVWTAVGGITHDMALAPCSASLASGGTKLIMGRTVPSTLRLETVVSFDGGIKWQDPVALTDPSGAYAGRRTYPSFVPLSGNRMFVSYGLIPVRDGVANPRLAFNVIQDESGSRCQDQADAAATAAAASPTMYVQRADHTEWPWPYGRGLAQLARGVVLGDYAGTIARAVTCGGPVVIRKNGVTLDQTRTLSANGVGNGDRLVVSNVAAPRALRVGFADLDTYPAFHRIQSWDTACDTAMGFDYWGRSLALDVPLRSGQTINSISLRDTDASTLAVIGDWRVWTSADGHFWTVVPGASATSAVVGGRLVVTFAGLSLSQRYVKVSQPETIRSGTFVLASTRNDVTVTTSP